MVLLTKLFSSLSRDERGFVISTELVLVSSVAVLGLVSGIAALQNGISQELAATADDFQTMRQSYTQPHLTQSGLPLSAASDEATTTDRCTETYRFE